MKNEAINIPITGISQIRYKIWDKSNKSYITNFRNADGCEWWTPTSAYHYMLEISYKKHKYEIHKTETITIIKSPEIVNISEL